MKRITRAATVATMVAVIAATGATAVSATPSKAEAKPGHAWHVGDAASARDGNRHAGNATAARDVRKMERRDAKKLGAAKERTSRAIAHKVAKLTAVDRLLTRARLNEDSAAAVKANVSADKAALADLASKVKAATTIGEVAAVAYQAGTYRPEAYERVVRVLFVGASITVKAGALAAEMAELSDAADTKEAEGADVGDIRAALTAAQASLDGSAQALVVSKEKALMVRASHVLVFKKDGPLYTALVEVNKARKGLASANESVEAARDALDGPEGETEGEIKPSIS